MSKRHTATATADSEEAGEIGTEIIVPMPSDALAFFRDGRETPEGKAAVESVLTSIRAHIDAFEADVETEDGRKAIKSMAYKVARAKTTLRAAGKEVADEVKALPKQVDATRKAIEDTLEAWQAEVRKPLDTWEAAEAERTEKHTSALAHFDAYAAMTDSEELGTLESARAWVESVMLDKGDHDEFAHEYEIKGLATLAALDRAIAGRKQRDADAAELAVLRAKEAERLAAEAEKEVAARAAAEAEKARQREAEIAAEAAARALRDKEEAEAREKEAEAARAQNRNHRAAVNRKIVAKLKDLGVTEDAAKAIVAAMVKGEVPNVTVSY